MVPGLEHPRFQMNIVFRFGGQLKCYTLTQDETHMVHQMELRFLHNSPNSLFVSMLGVILSSPAPCGSMG